MITMERKLIALDVDGTLIDNKLRLSAFSAEVLSSLSKKGYFIVLASGRPFRAMKEIYARLQCLGPVITYNGAHAFSPEGSSFPMSPLYRRFKKEDIIAISKARKKEITSFMCEDGAKVFLKREDNYLDHYFPYKNLPYEIGPMEKILTSDPYTCLFRSAHSNDGKLKATVESFPGLKFRHWTNSFYSEAHLDGVSKGNALDYVLKTMGIAPEDVYAFGDSDNDFEMLSLAGHPFSVKGCKSHLLSSKFAETKKDNDHDGVALTLKEIFF